MVVLRKTSKGDRLPSDWGFRLMAITFRLRDFFQPREPILKEVGIRPGFQLLDYGCGPGSYIPGASEMVGKTGIVYALDAHPLAIKSVQAIIAKKRLLNVKTILSECVTGLSDNSLDVVLLYDILHDLVEPKYILTELHRTLRLGGILSLSDHHLKEDEIISEVTDNGIFNLSKKGKYTLSFVKRSRRYPYLSI